ncbi:MAG: DUF2780 domain-containing protein [Gammaproteobacteria bacterium]
MIVPHSTRGHAFLIVVLALAVHSFAMAESTLMDAAQDAAKSDLTNAVPAAAPAVTGSVIENTAGGSGASLVDSLTGTLGISPAQAQGGAGSLFQFAKQKLGVDGFQGIADVVPGMGDLLGAAPKTNAAGGMLDALGGSGNNPLAGAMDAASLVSKFQQLGLSPDMVGKFIPVMVDYVQNQGGQTAANLLTSALTGL